jgi:3' terminal RNA ribose 2'-O-methyltransferase Hen1
MLLTITYNGPEAADLGWLLHKNPDRPQTFELTHGRAHVFYPELSAHRATAALLLDINPLDLARGKAGAGHQAGPGGLFDYVNDRPYVSSSFLSVALAKVFSTALTGRSEARQALAGAALSLEAGIAALPCRGDRDLLRRLFEPLGYDVAFETFPADEAYPAWGESPYVNLRLKFHGRLRDLLRHLYVLMPVLDNRKHYWIGADEVEKLLRFGEDWLANHPEKALITRRYLKRNRRLTNLALERLTEAESAAAEAESAAEISGPDEAETPEEKRLNLNAQRLGSVLAALKNHGAGRVVDLGCGGGQLLAFLAKERQFTRLAGMDVSPLALERARDRLHLDHAGDYARERLQLFQGSLIYRDARLEGYDAAVVLEVVEHLDPPHLEAFERVLFEFARPPLVVLTTPNREYNVKYENLPPGGLRHPDHRFEWTRAEFRGWAEGAAGRHGYRVRLSAIGDHDPALGGPTQMGVFSV